MSVLDVVPIKLHSVFVRINEEALGKLEAANSRVLYTLPSYDLLLSQSAECVTRELT